MDAEAKKSRSNMKRLFKRKNRLVEETPLNDEDIRVQFKFAEDNRPLFTDLYSKLAPYLQSASANCDSGKLLGETLISYGKKLQSDSLVLANCLQTLGEFHIFLEDAKMKLYTVLLESFCVSMKEFVDGEVDEALNMKKQLDQQRLQKQQVQASASKGKAQTVSEKDSKSKKKKKKGDHDDEPTSPGTERAATGRGEISTAETYYRLLDANERGRFLLLSKACLYVEEHFTYFKEGFNWISQIYPQLEKYRLEAECLEEEYNDNIKIRNGEISEEDLEKERVFGVPLEILLERQKMDVPIIVTESIKYLIENGASKEGILRLPGNNREIQHLKTAVDRGRAPDFSKVKDPHTVAGLLKMYLYSLPDPLLPPALFDRLINAAKNNSSTVVEEMKKLLRFVPPANLRTLEVILQFALKIISHGATNKMNPTNVSCLLAPAILYKPQRYNLDGTPAPLDPATLLQETNLASKVIEIFIVNFDILFEKKDKKEEPTTSEAATAAAAEPHDVERSDDSGSESKKKKKKKQRSVKGSKVTSLTDRPHHDDLQPIESSKSEDSIRKLSITIPPKAFTDESAPSNVGREFVRTTSVDSSWDKEGPPPSGSLTDRARRAERRNAPEPTNPVPLSRISTFGNGSIANIAAFYTEDTSAESFTSAPQKRKHDSTVLSIANPLALCNAMDDIFCNKSFSGWVMVCYTNPSTIEFRKSGTGGVEELAAEFNDDEIQYALLRLPLPVTGANKAKKTRDVFIAWIGPNIGQIEKGRKRAHLGDVKDLLQPFHSELAVTSKKNFTLQVVLERSAPHSGAHIID